MIKKIIRKINTLWVRRSSKSYIAYLRKKGVKIGNGVQVAYPKTILVDITRPSLIEIGNNVRLNKNLTILSHDGVFAAILKDKYNEFIPNSGKVKIGNDVYFGRNCTVMKGVTIGNGCVIGFGSIVTKDIPDNSFAVGSPAKVLSTTDVYYERRKRLYVEESFVYARSIVERFNRRPVPADFWEEFPLFVNGNEVDKYPTIPIKRQLGSIYNVWIKTHKKTFDNFDAFLKAAGID